MRIEAAPQDAALRADLEHWIETSTAHRAAYDSVLRMWRLADGLPKRQVAQSSSLLPIVRSVNRRSRTRRMIGVAAAALAACLMLFFLPSIQLRLEADHLTGTAELQSVKLQDGSTVDLDAGSAIAVDFDANRREVTLLSGQAFFEVVSTGRPFVVRAGDVTVSVTGTAFAVRVWAEAVTVAVQSGVVEVDHGGQPAARLIKGQGLRVSRTDGRVVRSEIAAEDVASWRDRRLVVDGATVGDIVEELRRHHNGVIVLRGADLAARRVSGVFDLRRPVEALRAVARTQHGSVSEVTPYLLVVSTP